MAISHCYWHLVVKNSNWHICHQIYPPLTSSGEEWQMADMPAGLPPILSSSGPEWQFHTATDIQWSRMAITHCYWHLVVKNGNFILLLTSSGQKWQSADIPLDLLADLSPKMHHRIYIMGCIWQPFWILQEKVGISFYFWIIRLVNSQ